MCTDTRYVPLEGGEAMAAEGVCFAEAFSGGSVGRIPVDCLVGLVRGALECPVVCCALGA
jgi:hypothetical protein